MIIFLDYDGTLTKNSEEEFLKAYFYMLSKSLNMPIETVQKIVMNGITAAMQDETPDENMFDKFLDRFVLAMTPHGNHDKIYWIDFFTDFYKNDFDYVKNAIIPNEELVNRIKASNQHFIFASNPLFPEIAVLKRIEFVGLTPKNFIYIAFMENSTHVKPNPKFFTEIVDKLSINPRDCIMIGDSDFDKSSELAGIKFVHVNDSFKYIT